MAKLRYTLIRFFHNPNDFGILSTEEVDYKTLKEATDFGSILTEEEKVLGSYIFDNVAHKKLTLKGERYDCN